jgi:hypothetical protein
MKRRFIQWAEKKIKQQQKNELKFVKDWFEMKKMYKSNGKQRE